MHWFKIHHGYNADNKLGLIAHKLNTPRAIINAIFLDMLEYGSRNSDRGSVAGYDLESSSHNLGIDENLLRDASLLLRDRHLITHDRIANWDRYQSPIDHTHADRQKRYRDKKKQQLEKTVTRHSSSRDTDKIRLDKKESKVGSRFTLTKIPPEWITECKGNRPDLNPSDVFDTFRDYWIALPGAKGVKLDWDATWRNWVRNQHKKHAQPVALKKNVANANNLVAQND